MAPVLGTGFYLGQWCGVGGGVDQKMPLGTCRLRGPGLPWDGGGRDQVRISTDRPQGYKVVWK